MAILGWTLAVILGVAAASAAVVGLFLLYANSAFRKHIVKVFTTKPLLLAAAPAPWAGAEDVAIPLPAGGALAGSLIRRNTSQRRGLLVFCHEFSGDRWLCVPYLAPLLDQGYDILTFDFRGHGGSGPSPVREPLQWVTTHDVEDVRAALAWAFAQPAFAAGPIGLFGVSKGGGAALAAAAEEPRVAALALDGAYPTHGTVVEYMTRWVSIFSRHKFVYDRLPRWFYSGLCWLALRERERDGGVKYPKLEDAARRWAGPLLMVCGRRDNYIPPPLAERFFAAARTKRKDLWLVDGAKHNRCVEVAGPRYHERLTAFFGAACPAVAATTALVRHSAVA